MNLKNIRFSPLHLAPLCFVILFALYIRGFGNPGKKYIENFKEDWQYRNEADSRMLSLGSVLLNYMAYNNDTFPPMHSPRAFRNALYPYLTKGMRESEKVFYHPRTGEIFQPIPKLSNRTLSQLEAPGEKVQVGFTRGKDGFEYGVLYFDPKSWLYIETGGTHFYDEKDAK